ncbi:unnamed protein product [Dicrocoelium dendriticum]|nr:unnamed protein product [Dicrocoelium dendriticum]
MQFGPNERHHHSRENCLHEHGGPQGRNLKIKPISACEFTHYSYARRTPSALQMRTYNPTEQLELPYDLFTKHEPPNKTYRSRHYKSGKQISPSLPELSSLTKIESAHHSKTADGRLTLLGSCSFAPLSSTLETKEFLCAFAHDLGIFPSCEQSLEEYHQTSQQLSIP